MKLQVIAISGIGHRVIAGGRSGKRDLCILPGRIIHRWTLDDVENHALDVVGCVFQPGNSASQSSTRMVGGFGIAHLTKVILVVRQVVEVGALESEAQDGAELRGAFARRHALPEPVPHTEVLDGAPKPLYVPTVHTHVSDLIRRQLHQASSEGLRSPGMDQESPAKQLCGL